MATRPNIIFIVADDMGYGDFGAFNRGISETPTLDHLMTQGITLTQHYSASPVCAPARAALLTGRYPHRTGAIDTLELRGLDRLALGERTLADELSAAGYATGLIGKWHSGALDPRYHPNRRGFAEFAGFSGGWSPYVDWRLDYNGAGVAYDGAYTPAVSHIYGMLRCMDRGVARLLDALDDEGIAETTLVIFTSDNGPQFGGAGDGCSDRFNCGFAGAKLLVYEGGIRVPAIVRWPAALPAGVKRDGLVHFCDWLPTLLAPAGVERRGDLPLDGVDRMPALRGEREEAPPPRFWQWNRYAPNAGCNAAMRDGDWKLVRPAIDAAMQVTPQDLAMDIESKFRPEKYPQLTPGPLPRPGPAPPMPPQLFNLRDDPLEHHDRAAAEPARVARMDAALGAWFESVEEERQRIPE
jgi:arylsulfatase A